MRLWHRLLIPYLPRQQLLAQWRECCLIARNIAEEGIPNHLLVDKVVDYPEIEFNTYAQMIIDEMHRRNYHVIPYRFWRWRDNKELSTDPLIFRCWHTERYLTQCYYNLEEKHDCGGIPDDEWQYLCDGICEII